MSENWKPGDVGITGNKYGHETPTHFIVGKRGGDSELRFVYTDGDNAWHPPREDARRLAVIDPEDREQVERLLESLRGMSFAAHACGSHTCLSAALRELANPTPPKPEEPTGLGAVVEDAEGNTWVRIGDVDMVAPWTRRLSFPQEWQHLDAVRVLSEGVTP